MDFSAEVKWYRELWNIPADIKVVGYYRDGGLLMEHEGWERPIEMPSLDDMVNVTPEPEPEPKPVKKAKKR